MFSFYLKNIMESKETNPHRLSRETAAIDDDEPNFQKKGVSTAYIRQMLSGDVDQPSPKKIKLLSKALGIPYIEMMVAAGYIDKQDVNSLNEIKSSLPTVKTRQIPVISSVQASHFKEVILQDLGEDSEYISTTSKDPDSFAIRVVGDCMEPEFSEGEIITVSPNARVNNGHYIVAMRAGDREVTFKQYKKYGDQVVLHPLNPKYEDIVVDYKLVIIGRVVEKFKRY